MKYATWNVNSLAVRLPQLLDWLAANPVDALVLQETKLTDDKFPQAEIEAAGYRVQWHGQKTYNGVALISRTEAADVVRNIPGFGDEQARVIAGTVAGVRVIGGYFPNGQAPDSDKFVYKMRWQDALHDWVREELARHPQLALMGDFNVAPEDRDVYDPVAWAGQIHCTPEERAQFQRLSALTHALDGQRHATLKAQLDQAFVNFQFGDRVSQMLSIVANDMNQFVQWTAQNPQAGPNDAHAWLERLEASYTMEEQRSEHHGNVHVTQAGTDTAVAQRRLNAGATKDKLVNRHAAAVAQAHIGGVGGGGRGGY